MAMFLSKCVFHKWNFGLPYVQTKPCLLFSNLTWPLKIGGFGDDRFVQIKPMSGPRTMQELRLCFCCFLYSSQYIEPKMFIKTWCHSVLAAWLINKPFRNADMSQVQNMGMSGWNPHEIESTLVNIGQYWSILVNGHATGTDSLVVPTIYKAYFSGLCKGIYQPKNGLIWYLHFRILEFSCIGMSFVPSLWILLVVMSWAACGQWDFRGVLKMQQWPKSQTDITQSTAWWMGILGFLLAQEPVSISSQADKLWQTSRF